MMYFTSGTRLSMEDALEYPFRELFDDIVSMNNYIVSKWNSIVRPNDSVYHLGDFGQPFSLVKWLHGRIALLPNHSDELEYVLKGTGLTKETYDQLWPKYAGIRAQSTDDYVCIPRQAYHLVENGFQGLLLSYTNSHRLCEFIYTDEIQTVDALREFLGKYPSLSARDLWIDMSYEPIKEDDGENPQPNRLNLYGHHTPRQDFGDGRKYSLDVSVDANGFKPLTISDILSKWSQLIDTYNPELKGD